jgi:hypothetical protein
MRSPGALRCAWQTGETIEIHSAFAGLPEPA